jgi:hypothetical protein
MNRRSRKKVLAGVLGVLLALSAVTAAVAYFTGAAGNATGSGTVGSSTAWNVAMGSPTFQGSFTALYPGATNNNEYLPFTITNNGKGFQNLQNVAVSMPTESNGDAETAGGADIPGCQASWFTAVLDSGNPVVPDDIAAGGTYLGKVDLTMQDSGTNQNACQAAAPAVTVTAS